ncbi:MAG TPA: energy transducer TonB [Candidatus Acidoferrales bacterium]|nr:energy transducer TonB [Candidatus Acidoferrales bacterium]
MKSRCVLALLILGFAAAGGSVHAQAAPMDALASSLIKAVDQSKQKSIVVLDFQGPGQSVTPLGEELADDLTKRLSLLAQSPKVIERTKVADAITQNRLARSALRYPDIALAIASQLKAKVAVLGELGPVHDGILELTVDCYRLDSGNDIARLALKLRAPDAPQITPSAAENVKSFTAESGLPKGSSPPICMHCPNAPFTQSAINHKVSGKLFVSVLVNTDGTVSDISPLQSLPYGLTWSAVHTVRSWKLQPAKSPDGRLMTVRQTIEVVFNLHVQQ